ncbi:DegT/DnrJ/EryC1/StrS family aminotransferase [Sneathiella limimaris]|uniref:DegT/DnrJ/EryC1/StrS family aminotransferase n=1 Tax=Sneathiella limimaris TaxID=1964213 RepID=UPI00146E22FF|nr:DegT/DnrJ/EryC1/StrS family aminotransferase [Sneathiella limimaris]
MKIKVASPSINQADVEALNASLLSGHLTSGPRVKEFEQTFADYVGVKEAIAVNSGTAALHAALAAKNIGFGDEVIVPALTFFSTVTAVIHQGAVPVFCDITQTDFSLCPEDLENHITPRTKAIIPVHYFGHSAEMDKIMEIANRHGLSVIEDCAQSHGTIYKGKMTGSIGEFGAFSMFATKHMTTCEGGMITTNDPDAADFMRKFRSHGLEGRNDHTMLGYNYRMPDPLAALGNSQLKRLDQMNSDRIAASEKVIAAIQDIDWLETPIVPEHVKHTYFWCHILIDEDLLGMKTSELIQKLSENGIECRNRYEEPLYKQPLLNANLPEILKISGGDNLPDYGRLFLKNSERVAGSIIGLPNRPDLSETEITRISDVLRSF